MLFLILAVSDPEQEVEVKPDNMKYLFSIKDVGILKIVEID